MGRVGCKTGLQVPREDEREGCIVILPIGGVSPNKVTTMWKYKELDYLN